MKELSENGRIEKKIFCTVIEPSKNWIHSAALLIHSLRLNGNAYAQCPFVLLISGISSEMKLLYEDKNYKLFVFGIKRNIKNPFLNKISAFNICNLFPCEHIIFLDHDTLILNLHNLQKFMNYKVYARRNRKSNLVHSLGKNYHTFLVSPDLSSWKYIPYLNSGVLIVPESHCSALTRYWRVWGEYLNDAYQGHALAEQIGLSMGLTEGKIPYGFLPISYNQTNSHMLRQNPSIIHYSSFDSLNKTVKRRILHSLDDFRTFLNDTDSSFWARYKIAIKEVADGKDIDTLSNELYTTVNNFNLDLEGALKRLVFPE